MTQREFIKLYAEVKPNIVKSLAQRGRQDAEDILQTTMLELCHGNGYAHVGATASDVEKFLYKSIQLRVSRFKSDDFAVRSVRSEAADIDALDEREHPLTNPYPALDVKADVDKAIKQLPESVGVAVRLVYIDGYTLEEAAKALGVPYQTMHKRLQRAMPALRESLKAYKPA